MVTHPRCANCHVGPDNIPIWTVAGETKSRPHGMNIHAGDSRIGAETLVCSTCHMTSTAPNEVPHAAPHVGMDWQVAPVEFVWFGKSGAEICQQMRDPKRNGGKTMAEMEEHMAKDELVGWGWHPGGNRTPVPGTQAQFGALFKAWVQAGAHCPA